MLKLLAVESQMIYEEMLEEVGRSATICGGKAFRVRTLLQMTLYVTGRNRFINNFQSETKSKLEANVLQGSWKN